MHQCKSHGTTKKKADDDTYAIVRTIPDKNRRIVVRFLIDFVLFGSI